mmetsp:Transcript_22464/g.16966  ORF Transcript_22464/g.16966 Transcript_22464/m.16966 type:complete len:181 (+) Transcript_22464:686-1228(+)
MSRPLLLEILLLAPSNSGRSTKSQGKLTQLRVLPALGAVLAQTGGKIFNKRLAQAARRAYLALHLLKRQAVVAANQVQALPVKLARVLAQKQAARLVLQAVVLALVLLAAVPKQQAVQVQYLPLPLLHKQLQVQAVLLNKEAVEVLALAVSSNRAALLSQMMALTMMMGMENFLAAKAKQ